MLPRLLRRDLRLHWDVLVLPFLILGLAMGVLATVDKVRGMLGLTFIGALFVPFLPMTIHLREAAQGTLGDLLALPVSRRDIVGLRYLEFLAFGGVALVLAHGGAWLALSVMKRGMAPFPVMDAGGGLVLGVLLLFCFAWPMPFALRWGGKGIALAYALLGLGYAGPLLLLPREVEAAAPAVFRSLNHLLQHPGQMALGILGLLLVSYLASLKAFDGVDV